MSAEENKRTTEDAYRAFSEGDAEGAMANMDDDVTWTVRGENSLSGTYKGKAEIATLWAKLAEKGLSTEPHDFIADGDKVVVLTRATLAGESNEFADVLTFSAEGRLIAFEQIGDPAVGNRVFAQ
jgi:uncharacterized protein